ncbi:2-amino-4-hydroxy-6-hydroxymethyldihydropteridine diphosphokinase [Desulfobotulus sp.]|uniref:2-amino-4-hydroxy-6- hydroxymethyldihydropteridine diphosphokinase n=1 Tax=Desulfobotulus sp. TaxID=1940337 RepID=UPI002A371AE2|nr:2-amino-4-hydroxy-6-hydroxymethyldihydropteridine diphosphokinase [Desulfobotulus sp.]MDY0162549.1 2-amino-4-hydroxy-6-hydroxymethyldihydropteridine diphosphokinase [Desulfobotulus sp.]
MNRAWISLGANLGDPEASLIRALDGLSRCPGVVVDAVSSFYRTAPTDYADQPDFVNAAARILTSHDPETLFGHLLRLQKEAGQGPKTRRFGPRLLDLDLLLYENLVFTSLRLILPHPRMHLRRFVLIPLCDMNPELRHPLLHETMADLLTRLPENSQRVERIPCPASLQP